MTPDPEEIIHRIRSIQQSLTQLQHQVIRGEIKPAEYQRIERERVDEIHRLEAQLAEATGQAPPERTG